MVEELNMKILINQNTIIKSSIGKQKYIPEKKYRWINFAVTLTYKGNNLIYNNLTKELVSLTTNEINILQQSNLSVNEDIVKDLIYKWFLVPTDYNEIKLSQQITSLSRLFQPSKNIVNYDILTTTCCNARCFYCYEAGVPKKTMNETTAIAVAEYIKNNCNVEKVYLHWFGGEPLCNINAIKIITEKLNDCNISFYSSIVTNGYLFDKNLISVAKNKWNLKSAQITLDGCAETYKRVKNYINDDPNPFKRVLQNIKELISSEIFVTIRLNIDRHNEDELISLVDFLASEISSNKYFSIYAKAIFEDVGFIKTERNDDQFLQISKKCFELNKYIESVGLSNRKSLSNKIKTHACMADDLSSVLISPEGKLGKCEHHVNDDFFGSVFTNDKVQSWNEYLDYTDRCVECPVFPTCLRPKNCPQKRTECNEYLQQERVDALKRSIKNTFDSI